MSSIAPAQHTRRSGETTDNWITPKPLIDALGPFDLDPCACNPQPWPTANEMWTNDGLTKPWSGSVWLNPPYGASTSFWLARLAHHGDGIALVFARTETKMFQKWVWPKATSLLFIYNRMTFCTPQGIEAPHNSGGPSVLIAYGTACSLRLFKNRTLGHIVRP